MQGTDPSRLPEAGHPSGAGEYDRDLNVKAILWSAAYLAAGVLLVCLLMYWLFLGLRRLETRQDPPPPPLAEERQPAPLPPEPRLQASPDQDMATFRAREDEVLHRPAWIDRQAGTVRLPIELAMDVIARRGVPADAAAAVPKPPAPRPAGKPLAQPIGSNPP